MLTIAAVRSLICGLDIDASTMTRAADRLVGEGLIARGVDPGDHRVNTLSLTAAGRRICARSATAGGISAF